MNDFTYLKKWSLPKDILNLIRIYVHGDLYERIVKNIVNIVTEDYTIKTGNHDRLLDDIVSIIFQYLGTSPFEKLQEVISRTDDQLLRSEKLGGLSHVRRKMIEETGMLYFPIVKDINSALFKDKDDLYIYYLHNIFSDIFIIFLMEKYANRTKDRFPQTEQEERIKQLELWK